MKAVGILSLFVLSMATPGASAAEELQNLQRQSNLAAAPGEGSATSAARSSDPGTDTQTGTSSDSFTGYKYIGNTFSMKFHRPSCPFARKMWSERIALIRFRRDAIEQGYAPCRYCLPPFWTTVHAVRLDTTNAQRNANPAPDRDRTDENSLESAGD